MERSASLAPETLDTSAYDYKYWPENESRTTTVAAAQALSRTDSATNSATNNMGRDCINGSYGDDGEENREESHVEREEEEEEEEEGGKQLSATDFPVGTLCNVREFEDSKVSYGRKYVVRTTNRRKEAIFKKLYCMQY